MRRRAVKERKLNQLERQLAVALRYDDKKDDAPRVIAKGIGKMAERIVALAKEKNIPIQENADLAVLLSQLNLGEEIPLEVYPLVAEILSYIYLVSGKQVAPATGERKG